MNAIVLISIRKQSNRRHSLCDISFSTGRVLFSPAGQAGRLSNTITFILLWHRTNPDDWNNTKKNKPDQAGRLWGNSTFPCCQTKPGDCCFAVASDQAGRLSETKKQQYFAVSSDEARLPQTKSIAICRVAGPSHAAVNKNNCILQCHRTKSFSPSPDRAGLLSKTHFLVFDVSRWKVLLKLNFVNFLLDSV